MQRALLHFARPENYPLVRRALQKIGREDLIGWGWEYLVPPEGQPPVRRGGRNAGRGNNADKKRGADRKISTDKKFGDNKKRPDDKRHDNGKSGGRVQEMKKPGSRGIGNNSGGRGKRR